VLFLFVVRFLSQLGHIEFHGWNAFGFLSAYLVGYFLALGYFGRAMKWWRDKRVR